MAGTYQPSSFMENQYMSAYPAEGRVKDALIATSGVYCTAQPRRAYPGHTANVIGLSDTIKITVHFQNFTGAPFSLSGYSPENWFEPVIYDVNADVFTALPLLEGTQVSYAFKGWRDPGGHPITTPTYLDEDSNIPRLVYYLWNSPRKGPLRVIMRKTSNAPAVLHSLRQYDNVFYSITTSEAVKADSINSYYMCGFRTWREGNYSSAIYWAHQILNLNPQSLVGYRLLNQIYQNMRDSTDRRATYDSLLSIMARDGDPMIPPTLQRNEVWQAWYENFSSEIKMEYWYFIRGRGQPFLQ